VPEYTLKWECNKCKRYTNRLIRFKNDETVTGVMIQQRKEKARYECHYCHITYTLSKLNKRPQVDEVTNSKKTGEINLKELRY